MYRRDRICPLGRAHSRRCAASDEGLPNRLARSEQSSTGRRSECGGIPAKPARPWLCRRAEPCDRVPIRERQFGTAPRPGRRAGAPEGRCHCHVGRASRSCCQARDQCDTDCRDRVRGGPGQGRVGDEPRSTGWKRYGVGGYQRGALAEATGAVQAGRPQAVPPGGALESCQFRQPILCERDPDCGQDDGCAASLDGGRR